MNTALIADGSLQSGLLLYGGLLIALIFILLFIPSLMVPGAKPEQVAKAISCYILKTFGLILLGASGLQLLFFAIRQEFPGYPILTALLVVLAVGIGMITHMSIHLRANVDDASEMIPRLVFFHTIEVLGAVLAVLSAFSLAFMLVMTGQLSDWEMSATLLILGIMFCFVAAIQVNEKNAKIAKKRKK